jgi:hypothetical protein
MHLRQLPAPPLREAAGPLRSHSHAGRSRSRSPAELPPSLLRQLGGCRTRDGGGRPTALLARAPDELCVFRCLLSAEAPTPSLPAADRPRTTVGLAHTDVCGYHARRRLSRSPPALATALATLVPADLVAMTRGDTSTGLKYMTLLTFSIYLTIRLLYKNFCKLINLLVKYKIHLTIGIRIHISL